MIHRPTLLILAATTFIFMLVFNRPDMGVAALTTLNIALAIKKG